MKRNIFYLSIVLGAFLSGCGTNDNVLPPAPAPSGTFTGEFTLYHINPVTNTVRADSTMLNLSLETATGFKITGDTTTLHAGSYGSYVGDSGTSQIVFEDKTLPPTGTPAKAHLNGLYDYQYSSTTLELRAYGPQDTLEYFYKFTRTGN